MKYIIIFVLAGLLILSPIYKRYDRNKHRELSLVAKDKFSNLQITTEDNMLYEQLTSNRKCAQSSYLVAYSTSNDLLTTCEEMSKKLILPEWHKIDICREISRKDNTSNIQNFSYYVSRGVSKEQKYKDHITATYFPYKSSNPYFSNIVYEEDFILKAKEMKMKK